MLKSKKFATRLIDMPIVSTEGTMIGRLDDIVLNDESGDISMFLITPAGEKIPHFKKDEKGRYMIPYVYVKTGKDVFVVDLLRIPKAD